VAEIVGIGQVLAAVAPRRRVVVQHIESVEPEQAGIDGQENNVNPVATQMPSTLIDRMIGTEGTSMLQVVGYSVTTMLFDLSAPSSVQR